MEMLIIRHAVCILLAAISAVCISINAVVLFRSLFGKAPSSGIPWIGGILGLIALVVCPLPFAWRWCWVPIVIDWGSLPGTLAGVVSALVQRRLLRNRRH